MMRLITFLTVITILVWLPVVYGTWSDDISIEDISILVTQTEYRVEDIVPEQNIATIGEMTKPEASSEESKSEASSEESKPEASSEESKPEASSEDSKPEASSEENKPEASSEGN